MTFKALSEFFVIGLAITASGVVEAGEIRVNTGNIRVEKNATGDISVESKDIYLRDAPQRRLSLPNSSLDRYYPYDTFNHCQIRSRQDVYHHSRYSQRRVYRSHISQRCP